MVCMVRYTGKSKMSLHTYICRKDLFAEISKFIAIYLNNEDCQFSKFDSNTIICYEESTFYH